MRPRTDDANSSLDLVLSRARSMSATTTLSMFLPRCSSSPISIASLLDWRRTRTFNVKKATNIKDAMTDRHNSRVQASEWTSPLDRPALAPVQASRRHKLVLTAVNPPYPTLGLRLGQQKCVGLRCYRFPKECLRHGVPGHDFSIMRPIEAEVRAVTDIEI